ncbi:hypothetical protein [Mesorhizobium sp. M0296]|uniref:hypothetical protein n=1 Tax=Mesorhizobium sp. M0296 TaxID=2956931 RepID=UPI003334BDA9
MMQIEDGKTYRSRNGNQVGPVRASQDGTYFFLGRSYTKDGHYHADRTVSPFDLVEIWAVEGPKDEPPPEHVMQFFEFSHLPPTLKEISRPFSQMAEDIVRKLPRNQQRTMALNKLLEAKDAAVRAFIAK